MIDRTSNIYIVIFTIILSSCGLEKVEKKNNNVNEIILTNIDSLKKDLLPLMDCKYVPLETNPNCMIGQVSEIIIQDEKIYILDDRFAKSVFVFATTGKYLFKVGNSGKGPKEYVYLNDFDIDTLGNIYLHDQARRKILKFDSTGQFVENHSYDFTNSNFAYLNDGLFLLVRGNHARNTMKEGSLKDNTCVIWSKSKGDIVDDFFAFQGENVEGFGGANRIYRSKNTINYIRPYEDRVFSINGNNVSEKYKIVFDQKRLPKKEFNALSREGIKEFMKNDNTFKIHNFFENEKFAVFMINKYKPGSQFYCVLNKASDNIVISKTYNNKKEVGFNFLGEVIPRGVYNDCFVSVIDGRPLESYIKQARKKNKYFLENYGHLGISEMLEDLKTLSNPIVVFYKFENF